MGKDSAMAARKVELLLNKTVENLGLVGDVVKVKPGYARNYLLPHALAEAPTAEKIEALKSARAQAAAEMEKLRTDRAALIARLEGVSIKLVRSVNDQGALYGAVTHRDIADQLVADGFHVDMRAVRLGQTIRRIGSYSCAIVFDRELRTDIGVEVAPDRTLELYARTEEPSAEETPAEAPEGEAPAAEAPAKGKAKAEKSDGESGTKSARSRKA
ncbi:MAG: 50S ribosomal protein L9 [Planctomycetes bacterium]|nr:50S ribosomal protein L9 [Planctomycetota bacterium]